MFGFRKKTETCFFCPSPSGKWKLDINTKDGVITKCICDECKVYLTRISNGESIYELAVERLAKDEDKDE
jgi:hypothetical protein